jgi:NTE family protein
MPSTASPKKINLALQGGGSHGAFAWGVLDRLLEEPALEIHATVGTSAGAVNATLLTHGLIANGRAGGRAALRRFWEGVSQPSLPNLWPQFAVPKGSLDFSPMWQGFEALTRIASPYQFNPLNFSPLRTLMTECVDFAAIRGAAQKLFLCAANVRTNRLKIFENPEISVESVLASTCLPFLFQAVEIDGEAYWDGGYLGNPPIFPLIYNTDVNDVLVVMINPINISDTPKSARDILDRINTLSFNSSLMREMRAIHFVASLIDKGFDDGGRLRKLNIHTIDAESEMAHLGASSKLNTDRAFLEWLFMLGRGRADAFLTAHFDKIGHTSSTDVAEKFL